MNATSISGAIVLALLVAAHSANAAPPSAENLATARELYRQGADALDAGDAKAAVEKLEAAWALAQTPVIGADLSRAHLGLGHLVEAREAALAVMRLPVAQNETSRSTQAREQAEKLSNEIAPRIPRVKLTIAGAADHPITVKLDGVVIPEAALNVVRQTNPGKHVAVIDTDDGRHLEEGVTLLEKETKEITLTLPAPRAEVPPQKPIETKPLVEIATPEPPPRAGVSPIVWVGLGVTGVGLAFGAIGGAIALSEASTVRSNCTIAASNGDSFCPPKYAGDLSAAHTLATISTIGFVAAGIGAAVLVTGLVLSGGKKAPAKAAITAALGGLTGTF